MSERGYFTTDAKIFLFFVCLILSFTVIGSVALYMDKYECQNAFEEEK